VSAAMVWSFSDDFFIHGRATKNICI
jgi:hypothetical protein